MKDIFKSKDKSAVKNDYQSSSKFRSYTESNFIILPDQKTIIGIDSSRKRIIQENIINKKFTCINEHKNYICTIWFNNFTGTLIAGDWTSSVIQYKRVSKKWRIIKKYTNLGIGPVLSSLIIKNILILGGSINNIRVIDLEKRTIVGKIFKVAVSFILVELKV